MASNDALARARSKLKANKLTQVTKEDGTTFQINIYDAAAPPKNKMKKAPPAYLEARQPPKYVEVPRFNFSDEKERTAGLAYLEENGYVVAKGVLNDKEVEKAKSLFWDFIEGIPNRYELSEKTKAEWPHRGKASTWSKKFPGNQGNGIINKQGAGQAPFAWFCRSRDKVAEVFSAVWETSDLIVSFDGFNAFRPWKINPSWRTKGGWYHVDQNSIHKPGKTCVQGLLSMYDVNKTTGGLTVIPGSHKEFLECGKRIENITNMGDFVPIPRSDPILEKDAIIVTCEAGDLCLWDSRTIHCNTPAPMVLNEKEKKNEKKKKKKKGEDSGESGGKAASSAEEKGIMEEKGEECDDSSQKEEKGGGDFDELLRMVCYICMTPASKASTQVIEQRRKAVKAGITTNHWPHEFSGGSFSDASTPGFKDNCERYIKQSLIDGGAAPSKK